MLDAPKFYLELFQNTQRSETVLLNTFDTSADGSAVAIHFRYVWTLSNGKTVAFECVDVFEMTPDRQQFQKLTIIYDTAPLRTDFEAVHR